MLQGQIPLVETEIRVAFVKPGLLVIGALLFVPAGEKPGHAFIGVAEILTQNAGGVREGDHVIAEEKIVFDQMPNESAEKRYVTAGTHWHPDIGQGARARKPRINMNDGRTALLRFHDPAEADRMRFGHRGAFD